MGIYFTVILIINCIRNPITGNHTYSFLQMILEEKSFMFFLRDLQNQRFLSEKINIQNDRETVYIDLTRSEEEIFNHYHKNHKRSVKKAYKNDLQFKVCQGEQSIKQVDTFYELYKQTMDKLNASSSSYFSTEYIEELLT